MGWKTLMLLVVVLAGISSSYAYEWVWQSGAEVGYTYFNITAFNLSYPTLPVSDNSTINLGETVMRDYTMNPGTIPSGGAHLVMKCYEYGNYTVVEATVWTDNISNANGCANGYIFVGGLVVNAPDYDPDDWAPAECYGSYVLWPGESKTWCFLIENGTSKEVVDTLPTPTTPTKTPIPPLATILVLITIPTIALRKMVMI